MSRIPYRIGSCFAVVLFILWSVTSPLPQAHAEDVMPAVAPPASAIAAGFGHTCGLSSAGAAKCWGDNSYGQLGDGTTTLRLAPEYVSGLSSGVSSIAGGLRHTCAVTTAGAAKCWGDNGRGQLGDGRTLGTSAPVEVHGLSSGVSAIAAGGRHTCGLRNAGVQCWGDNIYGQLGNGEMHGSSAPVQVDALSSGVSAIAAGGDHACALTSGGGVKCWGHNEHGQLGNGLTYVHASGFIMYVSGLSSGVSAIAAAGDHTCALTSGGGVKCWGHNDHGQLGDGTTTNRVAPVEVSGLSSGVKAIAAGTDYTCALTSAGGVKCWGHNDHGQLGDGTSTDRAAPVQVNGQASGVSAIAAGGNHTCGLTSAGGVKCWGNNDRGQLGDGSRTSRSTPADVSWVGPDTRIDSGPSQHTSSGSATFTFSATVAGSAFECRVDGGVFGACTSPKLLSGLLEGLHTFSVRAIDAASNTDPTPATQMWRIDTTDPDTTIDSGPSGPTSSASATFTFSATESGSTFQCRLDTASEFTGCSSPKVLSGVWEGSHTLSVRAIDAAGNTDPTPATQTWRVDVATPVSAIAAGFGHTCGLNTGAVACWGMNDHGQLGDGTTTNRRTPLDASGLSSGVSAITAGFRQTCAVTSAGPARCWGKLPVGRNTTMDVSTPEDGDILGMPSGAREIVVGDKNMCALTSDGAVKCWGDNSYGELGNGQLSMTSGAYFNPADVGSLPRGVQAIAAGGDHICALTSAGGVKCWGNNEFGQIGDGKTYQGMPLPIDVIGLSTGVNAIAAGVDHTCAVTSAGGVKCWGNNDHGQLGDGTTTDRSAPVDLSGLLGGVSAMTAGGSHTCALTSGGGVKCWGDNDFGQLGDGTTTDRLTPVDVSGLSSGVSAITAGHLHTCAVTSARGVRCWGNNDGGQLGDGTTTNRSTPVALGGLAAAITLAQTVTLTSTPPANPSVGGSYTATATGGASGSPVLFSLDGSSSMGACTVASGGAVSFTGAGNCVIAANQAGNGDYSAAPTAIHNVTVSKLSQTIDFLPPGPRSFGDPPFTVSATATSGLPVTITVASGPCTVSGATVTITGIGTCVITADQAGDASFDPAPQVSHNVTVDKAGQTITFTDPGPHTFGDAPFDLSATASSGLPVSFVVASGPCAISGSTLTITGTGTCAIAADQGGDASYSAAAVVTRDVTVHRAALSITASDATQTYGQTAPAVTPSYSGFVNGDGPLALSNAPTCGVKASVTSPAGSYATSCSGAAGTNYAIAYVNGTLTVRKAPLTITASDATSTYGDIPPAIRPVYSGFVNDEGPAALSTEPTCSPGGSLTTPAGTYAGATSCSGAAAESYAISHVNGTLTVSKRPLGVTADDKAKVYGQHVPTLTATLSGFVNGDPATVVSGAAELTSTATQTSGVGTYPITVTPGTLTAADYTFFTLHAGTLTVTPAPVTVTASSATMVVGGTPPTITAGFTGLVGGDTSEAEQPKTACYTTATPDSRLGSYPTTCTLADANYSPTYVSGAVQVTYGIRVAHDRTAVKHSGSNVPVKVQLVDASGRNLSSSAILLTVSTPALSPSPSPGAQPTGTFTFLQTKDNGPMYQLNVKTTRFPKATYTLTFTVAGDAVAHTAQFVIG